MMGQDDKDVEDVKAKGGHGEEVDRDHAAEVIVQESLPVLGRGPAGTLDHVFGDGPLGNGQTQLEQFPVNSGSTPERIGAAHLADEADGVRGHGFPAGLARMAAPSPEESKPRSMPLKNGAGLNEP